MNMINRIRNWRERRFWRKMWAEDRKKQIEMMREVRRQVMGDESKKQRPGDQPLPITGMNFWQRGVEYDSIQKAVIDDINERRKVGVQRYGSELRPFNGRNALRDAYEEVLDLAMYLKQMMIEQRNDGTREGTGNTDH